MSGLVPGHGEPEGTQLFLRLEDAGKAHVQRHSLFFHVHGGAQDVFERRPLRPAVQVGFLCHSLFIAEPTEVVKNLYNEARREAVGTQDLVGWTVRDRAFQSLKIVRDSQGNLVPCDSPKFIICDRVRKNSSEKDAKKEARR